MTARLQVAGPSPQGNAHFRPPLRAANSHSASLGSRPPTQRAYTLACFQVRQFTGCFWRPERPQLQYLPRCGAAQLPDRTHRAYCATVTSDLAIWKVFTRTECTGLSSFGPLAQPIRKRPPRILIQVIPLRRSTSLRGVARGRGHRQRERIQRHPRFRHLETAGFTARGRTTRRRTGRRQTHFLPRHRQAMRRQRRTAERERFLGQTHFMVLMFRRQPRRRQESAESAMLLSGVRSADVTSSATAVVTPVKSRIFQPAFMVVANRRVCDLFRMVSVM